MITYRSHIKKVTLITFIAYNRSMSTLHDKRIEPSEISPEILQQLEHVFSESRRATLLGADGERIELPEALNDLLVFVVHAMNRKQTIFLMPEDESFTTQAAATFLGMSRPYLLRLLKDGKLPFYFVGTHRRILFKDLHAFRQERDRKRHAILDDLTGSIDSAGLYDRH